MEISVVHQLTDQQLVGEAKNGDRDYLGVLYQRYYKKVFHKCLSYTRNRDKAFDLTQDIFIKVFDGINSFMGESSFSTWLFTITRNHCIEYLRKDKLAEFEDISMSEEKTDDSPGVSESEMMEYRISLINKLLNDISESDRDLILMKYRQDKSIRDIQLALHLNESAVKMRLQRARNKLALLAGVNAGLPEG